MKEALQEGHLYWSLDYPHYVELMVAGIKSIDYKVITLLLS